MKRVSYRERDYPFGQTMLTLRNAMKLSQEGLANTLGVSRRALGEWEAGSSYPKGEHLKQFILLLIQEKVFPVGHEYEDIHALWRAAHQKVLLDEVWLDTLLTSQPDENIFADTLTPAPVVGHSRIDWGEAITVPTFYGREWELSLLTEWVIKERCQVVSILGLGGIGKSSLTVSLMQQVAGQFEVVIWRSLRDLPSCEALFDGLLQSLAPQSTAEVFTSLERRLSLLLETMRSTRALLVLDNLESVLEDESSGHMRPEYKALEHLLRQTAETKHQSCVLLTSREKPSSLMTQEGNRSPVRALRLARLDIDACETLLAEKGVTGTKPERAHLIDVYTGNPLALKIVSQTINDLFDGEIGPFFEQGEIIFGGVRALLSEQFVRLSSLEQSILVWLAILREPTTLDELQAVLAAPVTRARLLEGMQGLHRRSLIERGQQSGSFTLQSVVLEYMTAQLITDASDEVEQGQLVRLVEYGIELAHSDEYVRQTQERLIAAPILERLRNLYARSDSSVLEEHLLSLLAYLSNRTEADQGYGPANLAVLLRLLRGDLRGVDLSHLLLRGLYLQGVDMRDGRLVEARIKDSVFTETFDAMTSVAISRNGDYWAASSRRGEIRIWEAGGHLLRQAWLGHTDMIWGIVFSPDGRSLASGSWDGMVKVWDVTNGRLLWSGRHTSRINRVAFAPDGLTLASSGNDCTIRLWEVASGKLLRTILQPSPVVIIMWSPDGHLFVSGDVGGGIRFWDMEQPEPTLYMELLTEHKDYIDGMSFSPDGQTLASGSWDGTIKLWAFPSGRLLDTLTGHIERVARVAWSPDGRTLASSGFDQTILLWDVQQHRYRTGLQGHTEGVYELAFTPDSRQLLSGSRDGTLRVWDVVSEQCVRVIQGYAASIRDVDWSPDGSQLISGGSDLVVTMWDAKTGTPIRVLQEHIGIVIGVGWSPNGRWLASSETEHAIRLWDLAANVELHFLRLADRGGNYAYGLAWRSDGLHLASGTHKCGVMVWDVVTGEHVWIGQEFGVWFPHVAWSPDGKHLAGGGTDGVIYVWNIRENSLTQRLVGHQSLIRSLAWSPDGTRLASAAGGAETGELFVWDVLGGERLQPFSGDIGVDSAVVWGSNSERLISGGGTGRLRWWDVQSGECLRDYQAHEGTIQAMRRSPDGTKMASCGDDGAIMLWDLESGACLQTLRRDRPYERLNITGIKGLTEAQKSTLRNLGAFEDDVH